MSEVRTSTCTHCSNNHFCFLEADLIPLYGAVLPLLLSFPSLSSALSSGWMIFMLPLSPRFHSGALSLLPLCGCFRSGGLQHFGCETLPPHRLSLLPSGLVVYSVSAVRLSLLASNLSSLPLPRRFRSLLASALSSLEWSTALRLLDSHSSLPLALSSLEWSTALRLLDSHSSLPLPPRFRSLLTSAPSSLLLPLPPRFCFRSGGLQHFGC